MLTLLKQTTIHLLPLTSAGGSTVMSGGIISPMPEGIPSRDVLVRILFLQTHRETTCIFTAAGVDHGQQHNQDIL